jgi:hypothetical protein
MTTILIKKKDTAGAPAPGDLTNAAGGTEIAVNTATRRIYTKDSTGTVVELGNNATSSTIADLTVTNSTTLSYGTANQVQYLNGSKLLVGSANMTFDGTTLTAAGFAGPHNGTVGATTANTGAFTTLSASSTVTLSGGTANGVAYLNGSKALTSGSALTFDGTNLFTTGSLLLGGVASTGSTGEIGLANAKAIRFRNAANSAFLNALYVDGSNNLQLGAGTSDAIISVTGLGEAMRIVSTTGNTGLGTSTPVSQLTIYSNSTTASGQYNSPSTITLWNGNTSGDIGGTIAFGGSNLSTTAKTFFASISSSVYASDASGTTGRLIFSTKSTQGATTLTERMRISETGLVGIGTQSPGAQLHVVTNASSSYGGIIYNNNATGQGLTIRAGSTSSQDAFNCQTYDGGLSLFTVQGGGRVGVGTSSPLAKLDITNTAASITDILVLANYYGGGSTGVQINFRGQRGAPDAQVEYGYIRSTLMDYAGTPYMSLGVMGGVMGVGTITPNVRFEVASTNRDTAELSVYTSDTSGGRGQRMSFWRNYTAGSSSPFRAAFIANVNNDDSFNSNNAQDMAFFTKSGTAEPAERVRILSNGTTLFGKTTASVATNGFRVDQDGAIFSSIATGNESIYVYSTTAGVYRFYVNAAGTVFATNTTISAISDQRLKENIRDLDDGLNVVMALKPRKFDWKAGKGKDIKGDRGFIAQEFEAVLPEMIETWKDPAPEGEEPYKAVNANLIPTLVKAMQEQQAIIESLKARLDAANL